MTTTLAAPPATTVLRSRDVAALLQCSASFVRSLAISGRIPSAIGDGNVRTFRPEDVSAFLEQREQQDRDLITLGEAARLLGYANTSSITYLIDRGVLEAKPYRKVAKRVARADVERLAATKGTPARRGPQRKG
ncbi:helix-turn-helix domain-containing protein [Burkholderia anthina]|uniref:helix-turn-helix domain-containing protein n=1 Tax=Burkholderia anthina TaxID=179879 RepID=UPI0037C155D7